MGLAWQGRLITQRFQNQTRSLWQIVTATDRKLSHRQHLRQKHLTYFEFVATGTESAMLFLKDSYIYLNIKGQFVSPLLSTRESVFCNKILRCMKVFGFQWWQTARLAESVNLKVKCETFHPDHQIFLSFNHVIAMESVDNGICTVCVHIVGQLHKNHPTLKMCDAFKCGD